MGPADICPMAGCAPPPSAKSNVRNFYWSDESGWLQQNGTATGWREPHQDFMQNTDVVTVNGVPQDGDDAWIPPKWTITLDVSTNKLDVVVIEGSLRFVERRGEAEKGGASRARA